MTMKMNDVVPWGRTLDEYVRMFNLTPEHLGARLLDCGGGPASFNAELTEQGGTVVSCDPLYDLPASAITERIHQTFDQVVSAVAASRDDFVWRQIRSPEHLGEVRMQAMRRFLEDFPGGVAQGRYRAIALPALPRALGRFELALCSHLLFCYSDHLSEQLHLDSIREMCSVAREARIFPLLNIDGSPSPFVEPVRRGLEAEGYETAVEEVSYEFQKGAHTMLRVRRATPRA